MPTEIKLPDLGDGIDSGDVLEVLVSEGQEIERDQGIVELETDKATVEVPSSQAGKVTKIHVRTGDTVKPGATLVTIEAAAPKPAESPSSDAPSADEDEPEEGEPEEGEPEDDEAPTGDGPSRAETSQGEPSQAETSQAEPSQAETSKNKTSQPKASKADQYKPAAAQPDSQPASAAAPAAEHSGARSSAGPLPAGPSVRRFAREVGVDLARVTGTGQGGRITRDDVLSVVRQANQAAKPQSSPAGDTVTDEWGAVRLEKMPKIRRTIASKMLESWSSAPRVTNFDDADVTELERIRQSSKTDYAERGVKLTSMPFVIKAVALALQEHPLINAALDEEQQQIVYKQYVNIGIAVDTERGLVVPSLRGADKLSIPEIAVSLAELAETVRDGKFSVSDLRGSTFTISNLGAIGGTYSTPIINVPEVAILLIGRSRKLPVVVEDQVAIRLMMPLSLSYDHRLVDGATAARFLNDVIGYLKAPSRLLLAP